MVSMGRVHNRNESATEQAAASHRRQGMKKILTIAAVGTLLAVTGCGKAENAGGAVKREAGNW